jgi:hypothetical protein
VAQLPSAGFHLRKSTDEPARPNELERRPFTPFSPVDAQLLSQAAAVRLSCAGCLRNVRAQVEQLMSGHSRVLLLANMGRGPRRCVPERTQRALAGVNRPLPRRGVNSVLIADLESVSVMSEGTLVRSPAVVSI